MATNEPVHTHSVTHLIEKLKNGDSLAEHQIYVRFFCRLVKLIDSKLRNQPKRLGDGEDAALIAFHGLLKGVEDGRFPQLENRDDLWHILLRLARCRTSDHIRKERATRRGHDKLVGESSLSRNTESDKRRPTMDVLPGAEPTADFADACAEEVKLLLKQLNCPQLQRIAKSKLQGSTNKEIAGLEHIGLRTVENRLSLIRRIWNKGREDV